MTYKKTLNFSKNYYDFWPKNVQNVFWDISTKNTFESKINLILVDNDVFNLGNGFRAFPTIFCAQFSLFLGSSD